MGVRGDPDGPPNGQAQQQSPGGGDVEDPVVEGGGAGGEEAEGDENTHMISEDANGTTEPDGVVVETISCEPCANTGRIIECKAVESPTGGFYLKPLLSSLSFFKQTP